MGTMSEEYAARVKRIHGLNRDFVREGRLRLASGRLVPESEHGHTVLEGPSVQRARWQEDGQREDSPHPELWDDIKASHVEVPRKDGGSLWRHELADGVPESGEVG